MIDQLIHVLPTIITDVVPGVPDPEAVAPPGSKGVSTIVNIVMWLALVACVVGFLVNAAKVGLSMRNGGEVDGIKGLGWSIAGVILIGSIGSIFGLFI